MSAAMNASRPSMTNTMNAARARMNEMVLRTSTGLRVTEQAVGMCRTELLSVVGSRCACGDASRSVSPEARGSDEYCV